MTILNTGRAGAVPDGQKGPPGPEAAGPGPEELSAARLRTAVTRMARWLRPTEAAGSLTTTEVDMLIMADRRGPARMSEFATFCGLNPTMLSRLVPPLEEMGLLARQGDPADKRASLIAATDKSRSLLDQVRSERNDVLSRLFDDLSPAERQAVAAVIPVLEKLAEHLRDQVGSGGNRR
jgi:DNA-binding MarR family transcriptional regulator